MKLSDSLIEVPGIGQQLLIKLTGLGLTSVDDLVHYYPRRYDDYSLVTEVRNLKPGQVTIKANLTSLSGRYVRRGTHITEALASDNSASVRLTWFNQSYRLTSLKKKQPYYISGKFELRYGRLAIFNPTIEMVSDFPINTARIVPRYSLTKGLTSRDIRKALFGLTGAISQIPESLPDIISQQYKLVSLSVAIANIHFPESANALKQAKRRLSFEELFLMILASELSKQSYGPNPAMAIKFNQKLASEFVKALPFTLTDDQRKAVWQIYKDLASDKPMNRLIEGDVGSGKTAVAAMAALMVVNANKQVLFMAPTELLARQHAETVNLMFKAIGLEGKVGLLIGALDPKSKRELHRKIKSGDIGFIIGTHALIEEAVETPNLALVIVDEQHRFGVKQREALKLKAKTQPHMLSLSATPIPRSLALTLFGELNISRLIQKPHNRQPIETKLLSEAQLERVLPELEKELKTGRQMFIVGPNIDAESNYSVKELLAWAQKNFAKFNVDLIHGRLDSNSKSRTMQKFINGDTDVLVSTTVIEVGIDVPNATLMLVFDAEHFGLAQLHQLRGRVGRGIYGGKTFFIISGNKPPSSRLKALESTNDGFKLAELDLDIRGPGAIYGQMQHGALDLRIAGLDDPKLINEARTAARYFVEHGLNLLQYPEIKRQVSTLQKLTNLN